MPFPTNNHRRSPRTTLGGLLAEARARQFVGRTAELEAFVGGLSSEHPAWRVLAVHGPGGIGKSALLDAFERLAATHAMSVVRLDCRDCEPTPSAVLRQLAEAEGSGENAPRWRADNLVVVLDTTEVLAPLTSWLWQRLLPSVPDHVRVVLAGRTAPPANVLGDRAWRSILRSMPLQPLLEVDVQDYLERLGVERRHGARIFTATRGYPLAVSLLLDSVDLTSEIDVDGLRLDEHHGVIEALLGRFVDGLEEDDQRLALVACAHARRTTEDLLREAVDADRAGALFAWLKGLSFVESGRDGLFPHDVAREVFDADLRWRAPAEYVALHSRIRSHLLAVARSQHTQAKRTCGDLLFLHRTNPRMRPFIDFASLGEATSARLRADDRATILDIALAHEGRHSAMLVEHWIERQPDSFEVYRAGNGDVIGFGALLALHRATPEDIAADPGAAAVWSFLQGIRRTESHEAVMVFRFFMDRDSYQAPSPSFNLFSMAGIRHILITPNLAFSAAIAFANPEALAPMFTDIDYRPASGADFGIGGRRYGGFFRDFGRSPVEEWLDLTGEREINPHQRTAHRAQAERPFHLDESSFSAAVVQALKDLQKPEVLAANPLRQTATVQRLGGDADPAKALAAAIHQAAELLRRHPRDEKLYRVIDRTYLRPAATQQLAAESLGIPFSTYRRHLARGVEQLSRVLWQYENGRAPATSESDIE